MQQQETQNGSPDPIKQLLLSLLLLLIYFMMITTTTCCFYYYEERHEKRETQKNEPSLSGWRHAMIKFD